MVHKVYALFLALLLASCGPAASPRPTEQPTSNATAAPEPAVTITFWHGPSGALGDRLNELIAKFNSSHKMQVQGAFQGTYDQLYQKIVSAIQARPAPHMDRVT